MSKPKRVVMPSPSTGLVSREDVTSTVKAIHVAPDGDGWVVQKAGPKRIRRSFSSQEEAVDFAKKVERKAPAAIIYHGANNPRASKKRALHD